MLYDSWSSSKQDLISPLDSTQQIDIWYTELDARSVILNCLQCSFLSSVNVEWFTNLILIPQNMFNPIQTPTVRFRLRISNLTWVEFSISCEGTWVHWKVLGASTSFFIPKFRKKQSPWRDRGSALDEFVFTCPFVLGQFYYPISIEIKNTI